MSRRSPDALALTSRLFRKRVVPDKKAQIDRKAARRFIWQDGDFEITPPAHDTGGLTVRKDDDSQEG